jgi:hypothetical protein
VHNSIFSFDVQIILVSHWRVLFVFIGWVILFVIPDLLVSITLYSVNGIEDKLCEYGFVFGVFSDKIVLEEVSGVWSFGGVNNEALTHKVIEFRAPIFWLCETLRGVFLNGKHRSYEMNVGIRRLPLRQLNRSDSETPNIGFFIIFTLIKHLRTHPKRRTCDRIFDRISVE